MAGQGRGTAGLWIQTLAVGLALGMVTATVWPTAYRRYEATMPTSAGGATAHYRENRFTGELDILIPPKSWEPVMNAQLDAVQDEFRTVSRPKPFPETEFARLDISGATVDRNGDHGRHAISCRLENRSEAWVVARLLVDLVVRDGAGDVLLRTRFSLAPIVRGSDVGGLAVGGVGPGQIVEFSSHEFFEWPEECVVTATPAAAEGVNVVRRRELSAALEQLRAGR